MRRGPRVVVRRGGRVERIGPSAQRRLPRGRGVLVATGATLGLIGVANLALSSAFPVDGDATDPEALLRFLDRFPLVALGAGLLSFAVVRDSGPVAAWIGSAALGLLAALFLGASVLFGAALPEAWREAAVASSDGERLELLRASLQLILYTFFFLYLALAVWGSRPRSARL